MKFGMECLGKAAGNAIYPVRYLISAATYETGDIVSGGALSEYSQFLSTLVRGLWRYLYNGLGQQFTPLHDGLP